MSLFFKYLPEDFRTAYNPVEIVLYEDNATIRNYDGFSYIVDIYDATGVTLLARLRTPKREDSFGRCDMHGVMESYVTSDVGELNGTNILAMFNNPESWESFRLFFGWEHYNGGSLVQSLNQAVQLIDSEGAIYEYYDLKVFNSSLPNYRGNVVNFYDWQTTGYYTNYTDSASDRKFLTNQPNGGAANDSENVNVQLTDDGYLYFLYINQVPNDIDRMVVKEYNSSGAVLSTSELRKPTGVDEYHCRLAGSPATLNAIDPAEFLSGSQPVISSTATSYSIALKKSTTLTSELMFYNIDSECRYETRRIEFLNSLGGFDYFNFTKVSRRSEEIERSFYKQNPDNTTALGSIDYNISDRQKVQFYTKSKPKIKLNSNWVDYKTFNWLLELIESPEIYLFENNQRIPIQNIVGNWEEKRQKVDKVFNLEIELEFGVDNYRQRW